MDLDGDVLAIGAPDNGGVNFEGLFTTYSWNSTNYTNTGTFNGATDQSLGQRVSLSDNGNVLAVSAFNLFTGGASVSIYNYTTSWSLQETLTSTISGDNFGISISMSGDGSRLGIGANNNVTGNENGRAEIYEFDGANWTLVDQAITGEAVGDEAGYSMSLSQQGIYAAIGAHLNDAGGADAGHVRIFQQGAPDTTPPTVTLTTSANDPTNLNPFQITITFNEEVTGFTTGDLSLTNGTDGNLMTTDNIVFTAEITATADGEVTVDLAAELVEDLAGNLNSASNQLKRVVDTTAPEAEIALENEKFSSDPFEVYFSFTEEATTLGLAQIEVQNATAGNLQGPNAFGDRFLYLANITPDGSNQDIIIDLPAGVVTDAAGNGNLAAVQKIVTYDVTPPTVTLSAQSPTTSTSFQVSIALSETVKEFFISDFTVTNGTACNIVSTDQLNYTVEIEPDVDGAVIVEVAEGALQDAAGNVNAASNQLEVRYDITGSTVEITSSSITYTNTQTFPITITFNEEITWLTAADFIVSNGSAENLQPTADSKVFTADIRAAADGEVTLEIPLGVVNDLVGNGNTASNQLKRVVDTTAPEAEITLENEKFKTNPFEVYFSFNEATTTLDLAQIEVQNATASNLQGPTAFGDRFLYMANITPDGSNQNIIIDLPAGVVNDAAGNENLAAEQKVVTFDNVAPVVTLNEIAPSNSNTPELSGTVNETATIELIIDGNSYFATISGESWNLAADAYGTQTLADGTYDVQITATDEAGNVATDENPDALIIDTSSPTVTLNDLLTNNSTPTLSGTVEDASSTVASVAVEVNGTSYSATVEGNTWTASLTTALAEGSYDVSVTAIDALGNSGTEAFTAALTIDLTGPTVTIEGAPAGTMGEAFGISFIFSEDVTGFVEGDITIENATLSNFASTNAKTYTATITPNENLARGAQITINLAENIAQDAASNGNFATTEVSVTYFLKYSGGNGTADDPFLISNKEDLKELSDNFAIYDYEFRDAHYKQTADIVLPADVYEQGGLFHNGGFGFKPIDGFFGTYDGDNHTIENLKIHSNILGARLGFFSSGFASIKNLSLLNMDVKSTTYSNTTAGLMASFSDDISRFGITPPSNPEISNVRITGRIEGNHIVGGFIGLATINSRSTTFINCVNEAIVINRETNFGTTGGFIAIASGNEGITLTQCINTGEVSNGYLVGGIIGSSSSSFRNNVRIINSSNSGIIRGTETFGRAGGLVGLFSGKITNSYNTGEIISPYWAGGIVGQLTGFEGEIANCFNTGRVTSSAGQVGGLVSIHSDNQSPVTNSFWDTNLSETETSSGGGTALNTSEMRKSETYTNADWDFETTWFHRGEGYHPVLKWQVENPKSFTVSGKVLDKDGAPFTAGTVQAINSDLAVTKTEALAEGGMFTLEDIPGDIHSIVVEPNNKAEYAKTYYGNANRSALSRHVISSVSGIQIKMINATDPNQLNGNGIVNGRVVRAANGGGRIVQGSILDGEGLASVTVFLVRTSDQETLTQVQTDENGNFEITGIPAGEYQLLLDVAGIDINLEGSTFTIDEEGTPLIISAAVSEEGVVFTIEEEVLGIENEIKVAVYPNPVRDFVNIQVPGKASIRVIDLNGVVVKEEQFTDFIKLNIGNLNSNMYFLEIRNGSGKAMRKLIKK
ncbi:Ig-like domain-containing protein [Marivirga sp.]|uniref:Ig-like domain-containing protein n=1 Tax=Marivirga sp. TaxID=2018662 RepID=UPI002D803C7D|nr:Ig-like domain-containing protein [Marivirga sp.]HET8860015.1 Ig-like domain-containing protein [Marivirga sp.]